jgi:hypothetical protein
MPYCTRIALSTLFGDFLLLRGRAVPFFAFDLFPIANFLMAPFGPFKVTPVTLVGIRVRRRQTGGALWTNTPRQQDGAFSEIEAGRTYACERGCLIFQRVSLHQRSSDRAGDLVGG